MRRCKGFTLIELLVAISIMALLALMSWRGLEAMALGQSINRERGDAVLTLQTSLAQWGADLDATVVLAQTRSLDWNGQVLRLTRRSTDSDLPVIYVVAWTLRPDAETGARWRRWQSPGVTTHADWQEAWDRAQAWGQDGNNDLRSPDVGLMPLDAWQLLYFRNNAWGPAVSAESLGTTTPMPDGIRLVLSLPPGRALAGLVTRDWVRPTVVTPKS